MTNDMGDYCFMPPDGFSSLLFDSSRLSVASKTELLDKHFLFEYDRELFVNDAREKLRSYKSYLFSPTALHIFVVTGACNQNCVYCQAGASSSKNKRMSVETARKAVDLALDISAGQELVTFEFQGGEPLLNFPAVRAITEYAESIRGDLRINYCLVSNLTLLSDEIAAFFKLHNFNVAVSLDGGEALHNANRPFKGGSSFQMARDNAYKLRRLGVQISAIQTTTRRSLGSAQDIVDAYTAMGFSDLFIRPLTKLGYAKTQWDGIGYTAAEFMGFFNEILRLIIEKNKHGVFFRESHSSMLLRKIIKKEPINYMELRSPCGAVTGQLAYNYDGSVYTCDEGRMLGEMGRADFCLGHVSSLSASAIYNAPACLAVCAASCLESLPLCSDCAYQPYCGVCPVINISEHGNLYANSVTDFRCEIYTGMMDTLFSFIHAGDPETMNVFNTWIEGA